MCLAKSLFLPPLENLRPQHENRQGSPEKYQNAKRYPSGVQALRSIAHQQQNGKSEHNGRKSLQNEVIGGRCLKLRVDFAQKNHAVAGRACQHPEHREEAFVLVVGIQVLGNPQHIDKGDDGTQSDNDNEWQHEFSEILETDGRRARHNHDVEAKAADAVEHVVVDVLATHNLCLLEAFQYGLEKNAEQRANQEIEAPKHGFQRVFAKLAQLHALYPVSEQIHKEIDEQHHANLHRELVD